MRTSTLLTAVALVAATLVGPARASTYDWSLGAKVTIIEVTYLPDRVGFQIDRPVGGCPIGSWLMWPGQGPDPAARAANVQAILAALMTAKSSGQSVRVFGANAGCTIRYLYLV